jgi:hypothetical protein
MIYYKGIKMPEQEAKTALKQIIEYLGIDKKHIDNAQCRGYIEQAIKRCK